MAAVARFTCAQAANPAPAREPHQIARAGCAACASGWRFGRDGKVSSGSELEEELLIHMRLLGLRAGPKVRLLLACGDRFRVAYAEGGGRGRGGRGHAVAMCAGWVREGLREAAKRRFVGWRVVRVTEDD
jgi:hypothetical protein